MIENLLAKTYAADTALIWLLAILVGILVVVAVVGMLKPVKQLGSKYWGATLGGVLIYVLAAAMVLIGLYMLKIDQTQLPGYFNYFVMIPIFATVAAAFVCWSILYTMLMTKLPKKAIKVFSIFFGAIIVAMIIATVVLIVVFFNVYGH